MALSALGALLSIILALIGQSPGLMRRLGLDVYRLDLRVRTFTGYAFACLLLGAGFFLAGVPLGLPEPEPVAQGSLEVTASATTPGSSGLASTMTRSAITTTLPASSATPTSSRPASGAFSGVPTATTAATVTVTSTQESAVVVPDIPTPTAEEGTPGTGQPAATGTPTRVTTSTPTATATPSPTPTATDTPTPTPTPTTTPTPSLTPTPVEGETAVIDSDGANIWLYRSPGGQEMLLVSHNDTVILLPRHANQGGVLWREVKTLQGVIGWLQARYLSGEG